MQKRPQLAGIFLLRCPYCLQSSLRKPGSWFEFAEGCPVCHYRYDREAGYFWGAPWMINYPLVGIICLIGAVYLYPRVGPSIGMLGLAALLSGLAIVSALFLYPYARAIWLVGDHWLHPLSPNEIDYGSPR